MLLRNDGIRFFSSRRLGTDRRHTGPSRSSSGHLGKRKNTQARTTPEVGISGTFWKDYRSQHISTPFSLWPTLPVTSPGIQVFSPTHFSTPRIIRFPVMGSSNRETDSVRPIGRREVYNWYLYLDQPKQIRPRGSPHWNTHTQIIPKRPSPVSPQKAQGRKRASRVPSGTLGP